MDVTRDNANAANALAVAATATGAMAAIQAAQQLLERKIDQANDERAAMVGKAHNDFRVTVRNAVDRYQSAIDTLTDARDDDDDDDL